MRVPAGAMKFLAILLNVSLLKWSFYWLFRRTCLRFQQFVDVLFQVS